MLDEAHVVRRAKRQARRLADTVVRRLLRHLRRARIRPLRFTAPDLGRTAPSPYLLVLPRGDGPPDFGPGLLSFLDMYGLVGCDICSADELPGRLDNAFRTVVFVAQHHDWSHVEQHIDVLRSRSACVVLEGPVSDRLATRLALETERAARGVRSCTIADRDLEECLTTLLDGYADASTISLEPIAIFVKREKVGSADSEPLLSPLHAAIPVEQVFVRAARPILNLAGHEDRVLMAASGNVLVSAFPMFSLIARRLGIGSAPAPVGAIKGERNGEALDYLLLHAIAGVCRASGCPLITVEPWPRGVSHVVSVRHDVDRRVADVDWARLRQWQRDNGIRASWYFLAATAERARIAELAAEGHEIAFHYTNLERKGETELAVVTDAAGPDRPIVGAACHGGNFHGQKDLDWLAARSFAYSEILSRCSLFPFRPVTLREGARRVGCMDMLVTARHLSVDASLSPAQADFSYGNRTRPARLRCGGHVVIMNHPDINFEEMAAAIASYMTPSAENWTQTEVVAWWERTHTRNARLEIVGADGDTPQIRLLHAAEREPMLRIWAPAGGEGIKAENLGGEHVVVPVGVEGRTLIPYRRVSTVAGGDRCRTSESGQTPPTIAPTEDQSAPWIDAIHPFRTARGRSVAIEIRGTGLEAFDRVRLVRGKQVCYDIRLTVGDGALSGRLDIEDDALQGLYTAVVSGHNGQRVVRRNAVMILDEHHHDCTYLEIQRYFDDWGYVLDDQGVPMKDMGYDVGFVRHPLVTTYYAMSYLGRFGEAGNGEEARAGFDRLVAWLRSQCSDGPDGSLVVRHAFPVRSLKLAPGWISGLTQGRVAEVFVEAWRLTGDETYLADAERLCRIMAVSVADGGLLAADSQGNVAIEEFVTEPPHWALNGIGSAINSLEYVASFVPMPWADELIDQVCRSMNAKIDLFDSPDYPGSRVQLAMEYPLSLRVVQDADGAAAAPEERSVAFKLEGGRMVPWLSPPLDLDISTGVSDRNSGTFRFNCILDANRDPLDGVSSPQTRLTLDIHAKQQGRALLSTTHNHQKIVLAECSVPQGRDHVEMSFDIAARLPRGIGRVARYDETYHETNLAWMWQLSRYGREKRTTFMARRWLYSFLNGQGRLPLAGSSFDDAKLLARRATRQSIVAAGAGKKLPRFRAAEAEIATIDEILTLSRRGYFSLSHVTPEIIAGDKAATISIFGLGFDGTEQVFMRHRAEDGAERLESHVLGGDEISVRLPLGVTPCAQDGTISLAVHRGETLPAEKPVALLTVNIRSGTIQRDRSSLIGGVV